MTQSRRPVQDIGRIKRHVQGDDLMSVAETKTIARRLGEELFNHGNLRVVDELINQHAVDHNEPPGTDCREHFKRVATMLRAAFPDLRFTIDDMIAEGEEVAARVTM